MDLLTTVKSTKLNGYGHVTRSSDLAKRSLQGTVEDGQRQGRPRKRWAGNIKEWTGLNFTDSQRAAEDRERCPNLVVTSSRKPQ